MAGHFNTWDSDLESRVYILTHMVLRRVGCTSYTLASLDYNRIQTGVKVNLATQNWWLSMRLEEKEPGVFLIIWLLNKRCGITIDAVL